MRFVIITRMSTCSNPNGLLEMPNSYSAATVLDMNFLCLDPRIPCSLWSLLCTVLGYACVEPLGGPWDEVSNNSNKCTDKCCLMMILGCHRWFGPNTSWAPATDEILCSLLQDSSSPATLSLLHYLSDSSPSTSYSSAPATLASLFPIPVRDASNIGLTLFHIIMTNSFIFKSALIPSQQNPNWLLL